FYELGINKAYLDATSLRPVWQLAGFGWSGVDLFFVLSGFLITSILLNTKESPRYFRSFYGRRAVRIFPLYFICLTLIYYVPFTRVMVGSPDKALQGWFWCYLANWKIGLWPQDAATCGALIHFWSLCVEEQFYFIWPLVVWITGKRVFPWLCLGLIVASVGAGVGFELAGLPKLFIFYASVPRMAALVLGSLLAWLVRQSWLPAVTDQIKLVLPAAFGLFLVCALNPPYFRPFYTLEILTVAIGWSALLLHCFSRPGGLIARIMQGRFLCGFGKYSYAIYVLHRVIFVYVGVYVFRFLRPYVSSNALLFGIIFAATFAASFLAGFLSWHL